MKSLASVFVKNVAGGSDEAVDKKGVVLSEWYLGEGWEQKLDLPFPGELYRWLWLKTD